MSTAPRDLPRDPSEFGQDPRVAFSKATGRWLFEDHDSGVEYEFDEQLQSWIEIPDEEAIERQQAAYVANDRKRKHEEEVEEVARREPKSRTADDTLTNEPKGKEEKERKPTAIYITGLPKDVTVEEVDEVFSKYGLIAENLATGEKRIKLYSDESGELKGDALVVYFKPESVSLAIEMMDGYEFRYGKGNISVQIATFDNKEKPRGQDSINRDKPSGRDKAKIQKRLQKLNEYVLPICIFLCQEVQRGGTNWLVQLEPFWCSTLWRRDFLEGLR
jgi:HIV Tat-specific factor 1